ncbi:unnamed protein product [Porites evermanni]|uniref:Uncharacterized protein n=1 Tax=Porites evermanni TaxID=104178 RepID=A0ABN8LZC0_9CNID|nr:unnamed protein product [Porites evermanni]
MSVGPQGVRPLIWTKRHDSSSLEIVCYRWAKDKTWNNAALLALIFVLLKVIPLRVTAENGRTLTTYGMLDSAAASSMITSNITDKLQLQGVPENVSINTVTQRGQNLELCKVKLQISSASQGGAFPVYHALTVIAEERTIKNLDLDKLPVERARGEQWNIDTYTFGVKTSPPSGRTGNDTR